MGHLVEPVTRGTDRCRVECQLTISDVGLGVERSDGTVELATGVCDTGVDLFEIQLKKVPRRSREDPKKIPRRSLAPEKVPTRSREGPEQVPIRS